MANFVDGTRDRLSNVGENAGSLKGNETVNSGAVCQARTGINIGNSTQNERSGFPTSTVTPHSVYLLVTLFWYFVMGDVGHEAAAHSIR